MWITEYWDLIKILTISNLRVKYQSSILGFAWSLINPLLMMLILYAVFSNAFSIKDSRYALYILTGIVTYRFFQISTNQGLMSIVSKPGLVNKVYIPRQILVFSNVLSNTISSFLEFFVLFALLIVFGVQFSLSASLFPLVFFLYFLIIYSISLLLASLFVFYRDLNQIWDVLMQAAFFLSPIVYNISSIPEKYLTLYMLNPITVVMVIFYDILLYHEVPSLVLIFYLIAIAILLLIVCRFIFYRLEKRFAEEV
jgi:lipopolysaccharide transport system permease protein